MNSIYLLLLFGSVASSATANDMIKSYVSQTYDWDSRSSDVSATCVNIPRNLTLCQDIRYHKMRLPNLLEHDSLAEVSQQASSWVPLLNVQCHPDTQRFLCSLFCPVCLDHAIYPCRSLCERVKAGCEIRMKMYGFPWPEMFACSLFPPDNDMCIASSDATANSSLGKKCEICEQINTVDNILDNYCQSSFAARGKLKRHHQNVFVFKKVKLFKAPDTLGKKELNGELFQFNLNEECCREKLKKNHSTYFIMGNYREKALVPTFIMPWVVKRSKSFKKSIKMLKTLNCTNPATITETAAAITSRKPTSQTSPSTATTPTESTTTIKTISSRNKTQTDKRRRYKNKEKTTKITV